MSTFKSYRKSGATAAHPLVNIDKWSLLFAGDEAIFDQDAFDIGTSDMSISFWIKQDANNAIDTLLWVGASLTVHSFRIQIINSGEIKFWVGKNAISSFYHTSSTAIDDDEWHHIVWTLDRDDVSNIYIDGEVDDASTLTDESSTSYDFSTLGYLGRDGATPLIPGVNESSVFTLYAYLNDFAMWDTELDANNITAIYNGGTPKDLTKASSYYTDKTSDLQVYWKMESGTGFPILDSSIEDSSGNGYTLTLGSSAYKPTITAETP